MKNYGKEITERKGGRVSQGYFKDFISWFYAFFVDQWFLIINVKLKVIELPHRIRMYFLVFITNKITIN